MFKADQILITILKQRQKKTKLRKDHVRASTISIEFTQCSMSMSTNSTELEWNFSTQNIHRNTL